MVFNFLKVDLAVCAASRTRTKQHGPSPPCCQMRAPTGL